MLSSFNSETQCAILCKHGTIKFMVMWTSMVILMASFIDTIDDGGVGNRSIWAGQLQSASQIPVADVFNDACLQSCLLNNKLWNLFIDNNDAHFQVDVESGWIGSWSNHVTTVFQKIWVWSLIAMYLLQQTWQYDKTLNPPKT